MMSGQWEKAVDRFHHLTQLRPEVELYWVNKSQSLLQMGDTTSAMTTAQTYLNDHPDASQLNDWLAGLQN
jgi:predicted Zn-dependent protease